MLEVRIEEARTAEPATHVRVADFDGPLGGYCVFGHVIEGMDTVDKIADVPVRPSPISNAQPLENVVITTVRRK